MCGITGHVNWNKDVRADRQMLEKMTETLSHRGPDETDTWMNQHVAFGHKRLSVIDIEGGKQPMQKVKNGDTYTLVYNGELYNTEELRNELYRKGYAFDTTSDTEVLLTAYLEWKEQCVDHLNGIFAFAVWDGLKEQLFIARDRLGVKPLFFQEKASQFIFGSELKAILAHEAVKAEVDRFGLAEVFGLGPARTPGHGLFKNMQELRAGHALIFSKHGVKKWRYWNVKSRPHTDSVSETVSKVRELFIDAVQRQLVADVPVSTFLSGGLDSSAITAIAANYFKAQGKEALTTFSVDYEGNAAHFKASKFQPSMDQPYIEEMAEAFATNHHNEVITGEELASHLKRAVELRDQPGMADIDSSLLWFCKQIKKQTTVSLSGECADEIFGGYPWFHNPPTDEGTGFPWMRSLTSRMDLLHSPWQEKLKLQEYVYDRYQETINETPRLDGESAENARRRELFYLNMHWFMAQLLDRKDRMSMGASLEVRVPYADHRLVEYVWNIPWEMKMLEGREKGILRKAMEGILPETILYRKKSPFPKTFQPAYTIAVKKWMRDILDDKEARIFEFLNREKVEAILETEGKEFKDPWYGQLMKGPQLIAHLCQIDYWLRTYDVQVVE
ncbi:asparagine synthase (glutamine-hydrolyzing) [Virgibacillus pantothenticus]|uniref:asparagine synthase (glutamine-hydrolyzing) n=1 Tax=Virgibacillus TaxID=84406 RepID=UPI000909409D|nr:MULTISPECIES: asparagine synthase (glutamine-hydrolyzing) [Virgibacillus]API93341.1 asparagine synthase (glutamine-hydrolyzing) [Virgibacillus sp. 6R]MBS7428605.1 asparagine synthase (glutamine-hydrolyzing) [Virgibacillus sp. 19R1-5]MBU8567522.1 asparagine synthase (glutamine-hydrolyzing) [Virgibacillus pantothenticus]MBU8601311.1 asparagine synthase (glutamine-hydrolyzing) [Virgibacillus pantothenticus]MBU8636951.1 asparagine synthase (glutamine-hydrolyzing) [Virgibacillus pantothenticus]